MIIFLFVLRHGLPNTTVDSSSWVRISFVIPTSVLQRGRGRRLSHKEAAVLSEGLKCIVKSGRHTTTFSGVSMILVHGVHGVVFLGIEFFVCAIISFHYQDHVTFNDLRFSLSLKWLFSVMVVSRTLGLTLTLR